MINDMAIRRIVTNIRADDISQAERFYGDTLGLDVLMDHGWIRTYGADAAATVQVSIATEGGSGTPVPDVSIEVDDVDAVHQRMIDAGFEVTYGPADEPWGVRRFYGRDPFGTLVNILSHAG